MRTVHSSIAISKVYEDAMVDKFVLFIFVAMFLQSVPWAMDATMRMLARNIDELIMIF